MWPHCRHGIPSTSISIDIHVFVYQMAQLSVLVNTRCYRTTMIKPHFILIVGLARELRVDERCSQEPTWYLRWVSTYTVI